MKISELERENHLNENNTKSVTQKIEKQTSE